MAKRIHTITGPVEIDSLGLTLPHEHLLLSHDAGWYNPARSDSLPDEGYRGYTALVRDLLPELLRGGITEEQVRCITVNNPASAFAF